VNEQKLRRLKGCWAVPAWIVIGLGVVYEVVHFLEAVDFVIDFHAAACGEDDSL